MTFGEITTIVTIAIATVSLIIALLNNKRATKSDNRQDGILISDIGYIKAGIDDMKRHAEEADKRHYALEHRVTEVEASTKQAHKRIDRLEEYEHSV